MPERKPRGKHKEKHFTAAAVRSISTPGFYADGHGLYLKVDGNGAKRWVQRIVVQGKRRDIGLGSVLLISLAEARELAVQQRKLARSGGDPIAEKKRSQAVLTFEEAARRVHDLSAPTWRNGKHVDQWWNTLQAHVFPHFGSKQVNAITSADVLAALTPIWNKQPETARRVKQRIGTVLKWAVANGMRKDNPADAVSKALPKHDRSKVQHRLAVHYDKVGNAISRVQASKAGEITKLVFEFSVLTVTRSSEARLATWNEIDLEKAEWVIPASRMKAKKPHRIPLSARAVAILEAAKVHQQAGSDLVFPGTKFGRPLSDMTVSKLMKELGIPAVPHGFRSSFRDWAGEATHHQHEVIEAAMAHQIANKAEAAYARSDLFSKRRALMTDWDRYLEA